MSSIRSAWQTSDGQLFCGRCTPPHAVEADIDIDNRECVACGSMYFLTREGNMRWRRLRGIRAMREAVDDH